MTTRHLLVEDDATLVEVIGQIFEMQTVPFHSAAGSEEALAVIARETDIETLVADFNLAGNGLNGVELIRAARRIRPSIKAVLMSGNVDAIDLQDLEEGAGDTRQSVRLLRKPFRIAEFIEAAL